VTNQFIRLGSNLVLAWLLTPDSFGMAALAVTFFVGLVLISDIGTEASLIRSKNADTPAFYNTVFTIQLGRGALLFLVCLILAHPLAGFYGEPALGSMIVFGGFGLFLQSLRSTSWSMMERGIRIKRLTVYEMVAQLLGVGAMISYALIYPDPLALIIGFVVSIFVKTLLSHWLHRHEVRNRLAWDKHSFREIFHFGKWVFISSTFSFLSQRSDRFVLGKLASVEALGVYHIAMMLAELPRFVVNIITAKLLYPMFAYYAKKDIVFLRQKYFLVRKVLLPCILLISLVIVVTSDLFFFYLYKGGYHDAMWMTPCLILMLWFDSLIASMDRIPLVLGDSRLLASTWALIMPIKIVLAYVGYVYFGIVGFITGLAIGSAVGYLRLTFAARKNGFSSLYEDSKYTLVLLMTTAIYFSLKVWLAVPLYGVNIWLSGLSFLFISLFGGVIIIGRIKRLIAETKITT